jgi:nitroreductase
MEPEDTVDTLDAILTRRSIRRYTGKAVSEALIRTLLNAAMSAPSAGNEQPWQFILITERRLLDEIPTFHPYADMLGEASVAILVCGDLELERYKGSWVQDCSAATENLLLAAHAKGLGAVWVGIYPKDNRVQRMQKLLGLPAHVIPLALVPIGYPAERIPPVDRYDGTRIHSNGWR